MVLIETGKEQAAFKEEPTLSYRCVGLVRRESGCVGVSGPATFVAVFLVVPVLFRRLLLLWLNNYLVVRSFWRTLVLVPLLAEGARGDEARDHRGQYLSLYVCHELQSLLMLIERSWEGERDAPSSDRAIAVPKP